MGFVYASAVPVDSYLSLDSKNPGNRGGARRKCRAPQSWGIIPIWSNLTQPKCKWIKVTKNQRFCHQPLRCKPQNERIGSRCQPHWMCRRMVMNRFAGYFLNLFLLPCDEWIHLSNVVILLFLLIQLPLDGEATSFVLFHASTTTTTTTKTSRLRNRDGDSDYQMKIAELFMVAQYYGALYLASIQYCRFYFVPVCFLHCTHLFFSGICLYRMWT